MTKQELQQLAIKTVLNSTTVNCDFIGPRSLDEIVKLTGYGRTYVYDVEKNVINKLRRIILRNRDITNKLKDYWDF